MNKLLLIFIILISIVYVFPACQKGSKSDNSKCTSTKEIPYATFEEKIFSININEITSKELIEFFEKNNIDYRVVDLYDGGLKSKYPLSILTGYFIGKGLDDKKIYRVFYNFSVWGTPGNEIEIEFDISYYDKCIAILTSKFGSYVKVGLDGKNNQKYYNLMWKSDPIVESSIDFVGINKYKPLYLGEFNKKENTFYMLIRGRDMKESLHIH